ncbi:hypothetical protein [Azospirillum picis]|uniref:Transposase n=1 Tax=Azospirillum picis TaxID=488438 RepID=A0ABU0MNL5_9PROT|nr:hypothetical protein [Azospirillum picis]MBP2301770.1 hypothetical protein [Azospirillum picis]MDQ0535055.1 hypothetical protein [Azospirillum picis]
MGHDRDALAAGFRQGAGVPRKRRIGIPHPLHQAFTTAPAAANIQPLKGIGQNRTRAADQLSICH